MAQTIQFKRGPFANIGSIMASAGEPIFDTTHNALYIGKSDGSGGVVAVGSGSASGTQGSNGAGYGGTSVSSVLIATGSKTFVTQAGLAYVAGSRVRVAYTTTPTNYVEGIVTSYSGTSLVINVDTVGGSGTFTAWSISIAGNVGTTGSGGGNMANIGSPSVTGQIPGYTDLTGTALAPMYTVGGSTASSLVQLDGAGNLSLSHDTASTQFTIESNSDTSGQRGIFLLKKDQGTAASRTRMASADMYIGSIQAQGYTGGSSYMDSAAVQFFVDGVPASGTANRIPGRISLWTAPDGGSNTERLRITSTGQIGIGTLAPTAPMHILSATSGTIVKAEGFGGSAVNGPTIGTFASRGTSGTQLPTLSGDMLGGVNFRGYFTTDATLTATTPSYSASSRAGVFGYAEENYVSTQQGSYLTLETTAKLGIARTEKMRVWGSGGVSINNITDPGVGYLAVNSSFAVVNYSDTTCPSAGFRRTRGNEATPTTVVSGDEIGKFQFQGYDGTAYQTGALIEGFVDAAATSGSVPTRISFTTGANSGTRAERMRITSAGNVGIGVTTPTSILHLALAGVPVYANNAGAISGGLTAGSIYRNGADPDMLCIVH